MRSFKEHLMESSDLYYFYISCTIENMKIDFLEERDIEKQIKKELKSKYKYNILNINYWQPTGKLTLSIACNKNNANDLNIVQDAVYFYLSEYFKTEEIFLTASHAYLYDINNTFLIKADKIAIANATSLKGIHTKIECRILDLIMSSKVIDGGLGILKIKHIEKLITNTEQPWSNIIKKYLQSKDLLACQDDLLENGLKDYAKL